MKTKLQIKSIWGELLFEFETDGNTILKTLKEGVRQDADLRSADLRDSCLRDSCLRSADLRGANLRSADLRDSCLLSADLRGADLRGANLWGANLRDSCLRSADLQGADLRGADLWGADLWGADLRGAKNFTGQELWFQQTRILPEGDIIGYKKCNEGKIVKLLIPKEAKRNQAFGRKCRAEYAKVLEISKGTKATSQHDPNFIYKVGDTIKPTENFDEDWQNECSTGIHFFITRVEAENY